MQAPVTSFRILACMYLPLLGALATKEQTIKHTDFPQLIGELSTENKIMFYELLAHRLTIAVRDFWSDESTSDKTKISQMKWLNEILHRVTSKIRVVRLQLHEWSEEDFNQMIIHYVKQEPSISSMVAWAIESAYKVVSNNGVIGSVKMTP